MIYRWYKILSPRIVLTVECNGTLRPRRPHANPSLNITEFNQNSNIFFVEIHQIFSLFFIPFYKSNVHLTTKLHLVQSEDDKKYYIKGQEDLYQLNEVVKFFWPGGSTILWFWQLFNTLMCIAGALILAPITWLEQGHSNRVNGVKKGL